MKKLLLLAALLFASPALAQPVQCPDQPLGSSTNACANTRFVINNAGGGGISTLTNNHIFVGNASNVATDVAMSGDCSIVAAGAITCTKTNGVAFGTIATQNANAVAITGGTSIFSTSAITTATLTAGTVAGTPAASTDIANKAYVDSVAQGRTPLAPVRLATDGSVLSNTPTYANGTAGVGATLTAGSSGVLSVDSTVVNLNDRLLIKDQAAQLQNGCYTMTTAGTGGVAYILTRCTDSDTAAELPNGLTTLVSAGAININSSWTLNQPNAITVGTTALPWIQTGVSSASYWSLNGSDIYKNNAGKVGIGTTTPGTALDVIGGPGITTRFSTATNTGGSLILGNGTQAWQAKASAVVNGDLSIVNPSAASAMYFAATTSSVGIGNTSPQASLDVGGTIRSTNFNSAASGAGIELLYNSGINTGILLAFDRTAGTYKALNFSGSTLTLNGANGTNGVFIDASGRVNVNTTTGVTGANFQVAQGSFLETQTNPTMQQALCYGFESPPGSAVGACETDAMVVNLTYTAGATTTGSAIRGTTLLQKGASTGLGVVGISTNYGTGVQSELVGVYGGANWYGAGSGNAVWAITGGTGADSGVAGAFEASNKALIAPAWGLRINAESPATVSYVTAGDWADFTSFGLVLRNTQTASWPIYITNSVGVQIYGVNQVGAVVSGSDARFKNDKGLLANGALDRIAQLKPRTFTFKDASEHIDAGFFAQEVQDIIPEAVSENDTGHLMLAQMPILANAIKAIQELKADNDNLRACQAKWKCRIFGWR